MSGNADLGARPIYDCHVNIWDDRHVLPIYERQLARVRPGAMAEKADADVAGLDGKAVGAGPELLFVDFDDRAVAVYQDSHRHAVGGVARARRIGPGHLGAAAFRRLATVEEVANLVVYVCSPQASATTGAALRVDGGVIRSIA